MRRETRACRGSGLFFLLDSVCRNDQLHRAHCAPDAGHRQSNTKTLFHRPFGSSHLCQVRALRGGRRLCHLPLLDATGKRTRLFLRRDRTDRRIDALGPSGSSPSCWSSVSVNKSIKYLISFAILFLRSRTGSHTEGRPLPGGTGLDCQVDTVIDVRTISILKSQVSAALSAGTVLIRSERTARSSTKRWRRWCERNLPPSRIRTTYEFLRDDFAALNAKHGRSVSTTFRNFPSFLQCYMDVSRCSRRLQRQNRATQAADAAGALYRAGPAHTPVHGIAHEPFGPQQGRGPKAA